MGDLDFIVEDSITMRDINSTLQKHSDKEMLEDCVSPCGGHQGASSDIPERDALKGREGIDVMNSAKPFESDHELETCDSLRRRKRKQENMNIQRISPDFTLNNQPALSQQDTIFAGGSEYQQNTAGKVEKGGNSHLQACGSPEISRRRKRKRETNKLHEVGLDISLRTDGSHSLQALGFDISVSSTVALGIKHASCCVLPDKDTERAVGARLAIGVVNNEREERVADIHEELLGTTLAASGVSKKDLCSMSTTKRSGRKNLAEFVRVAPVSSPGNCGQLAALGVALPSDCKNWGQAPLRLEDVCSEGQAESQKLRIGVAAMHSQLKSLYNLAETGSKDCGNCQLIKKELSKLLSNYSDIFTAQVSFKNVSTPTQELSFEEAHMYSSPVGSSTMERTAVEKEACERHLSSAGKLESSLSAGRESHLEKDEEPNLPSRIIVHEDVQEASDAECHLCIELGSSQSEDPDAEEIRGGSLEREDCNLNAGPLSDERACNSGRLQTCFEENRDCSSRHGEDTSEVEKHTKSSQGVGVADDRKGEELSVKSSKDEDCLNSAITRDSYDSCVGGIDDQAEKDGYIDLKCGCTSQKYGDTVGILRLYQNGKLEIQCQCSMGCIKGKPMSPASFERHGGRGASKKWRDTVWIVLGDRKVQFSKVKGLDAFVRRYKDSSRTMLRQSAPPKQSNHRDEFLQCKKCLKRRRFRRKTKEECRLFHEASMNLEWECSNYPFESLNSCQDDEEREARQANRGCVRSRTCPGCIECVCLGCFSCRFEDCECRLCTEYVANNK